ncbi:MAG: pectate lyase, partial [Clostridia bacterium]|nr:pectate lyase [Clostridia bacterium]
FWDSGKCNLLGNGTSEASGEGGATHLTYHHNWYDHSDSRHPRIRISTVHVYNNYFDGNSKYGVGVTSGANAFVENNYYRSTAKMKPMMSSLQGTDIAHGKDGQTFSGENGGMIKAYGNHFEGNYELLTQNDTESDNIDCYLAAARDEIVPASYKTKVGGTVYNNFDTAADMYEYEVDTAEVAKEKVQRYAGRVDGGDLKWEFDNATEDGNYAIIPGLKAAVTGYKTGVVKIGGVAVPGGTTTGGNEGEGGDGEGGTTNPPATIDGEIKFVPSKSGSIFTVSGNVDSNSTAKTVDGVSISAKSALKLESATSISFTIDKAVTLTVYVDGSNIKVDGTKKTSDSSADGLAVITVELAAGEHKLEKADKGTLYLIKLTPKS